MHRIIETAKLYSFEVFTIVTKNFILHEAETLDLSLLIEKIDVSVRFVLHDC